MSARCAAGPQMLGDARSCWRLLAFAIFGPLANLFLWAFAEKWYFPNKIPQEFGFSFWARVFSPRGGAVASLGTSIWIAVLTVVVEPRGRDSRGLRARAPQAALARRSSCSRSCCRRRSRTCPST